MASLALATHRTQPRTYPLARHRPRRGFRLRIRARTVILVMLALCVLLGGVAIARRAARPDPQALLATAEVNLAAGNYHAARGNALAAIAAGVPGSTAHVLLARTGLLLDDGLAAEAALDRAVATGAPSRDLRGWRAHARLLQDDAPGALAETASDRSAYSVRIRARALAVNGNPAGAARMLVALVAADPRNASAWTDLGRLRLTGGDVGGASQAASRAVAVARHDPAALTLAGEIVRTRFGLVAALPWFAAALKRDAYYHPALIEQAATLGDLGRYREMLAATRKALASRPASPQALYLQAVLAARAGRPGLARRLLQLTGGAIDGVPGVQLLGGALDFKRGDYDQAVARWRRLLEAQPMNVQARRLLALALLKSGDPRASLDMLGPLVLRTDSDSYTLRLAARGLERTGDLGGAAALLDRAAGSVGRSAPFASNASIGALAAAATDTPDEPANRIALIRGLLGNGDLGGAVARARGLVAASPGAPAAHVALGDTLSAAERRQDAAASYARAADLAFDAPAMLRLVDALGAGGRAQDAAAALALYLSQNPHSVEARRILGHWQVAAADYPAAIATLQGVRQASGARDAGLLADLAFAHAGAGHAAAALHAGRAAYALAPMNLDAIRAYAAALTAAGDRRARQLAAKARAIAGQGSTP